MRRDVVSLLRIGAPIICFAAFLSTTACAQVLPPLERELGELQALREAGSWKEFAQSGETLLARDDLSAKLRNDTLEIVALAWLRIGKKMKAKRILRRLCRRDPEHFHRRELDDKKFLKEVRRACKTPPRPLLMQNMSAETQPKNQVAVDIRVGDASDRIDKFVLLLRKAASQSFVKRPFVAENKPTMTLPIGDLVPGNYEYRVQAWAPSGALLGELGNDDYPLHLKVRAALLHAEHTGIDEDSSPWPWLAPTIVALAAGIGVGLYFAFRPDDPIAPESTLGTFDLK